MLFNILVFSLHYVIRLLYFFKDLSEVSVSRSCTLIIQIGHTGDRESHIYFLTLSCPKKYKFKNRRIRKTDARDAREMRKRQKRSKFNVDHFELGTFFPSPTEKGL